jgi:hypothetical protein
MGSPGRGGLYVLWFDAHAPTRVAVFADGSEAALEDAASFVKDHWPGDFVDSEHLKNLYDEAMGELVAGGADPEDEETQGKAQENATADMTYTESGYLGSDDWGFWCDSGEGHPCDQGLMDAIAVAGARELLADDRNTIDDVAEVVRHLRGTPLWEHVAGHVPVWGDETEGIKALLAGTPHGELISWHTAGDDRVWRHQYLLWRPDAPHERQRAVVVEHDKLFPDADEEDAPAARESSDAFVVRSFSPPEKDGKWWVESEHRFDDRRAADRWFDTSVGEGYPTVMRRGRRLIRFEKMPRRDALRHGAPATVGDLEAD